MPIDQKQRQHNTWNKLEGLRKGVKENSWKDRELTPNSQGRKGKELVTSERIHSGKAGGDEIMEDHYNDDRRAGQRIADTAEKTIMRHEKQGKMYGAGHNMSHHGEGKPYGEN